MDKQDSKSLIPDNNLHVCFLHPNIDLEVLYLFKEKEEEKNKYVIFNRSIID